MRSVAGHATFRLHHRMLVYKWPSLIRMALEAHCVLRCSGAQLSRQESSVWIVAVAALDQPFVDAVMERARELLLGFQVTAVAQLRLLIFH